jgi:FlaA1/EpsC-like NDP-sugar epimerase
VNEKVKNLIQNLLTPTFFKRVAFFVLSDILISMLSLYLAFLIRFDFSFSFEYKEIYINLLPFFIIFKIFVFWVFKVYKITWRYVSITEVLKIGNSTLIVMFGFIFMVFISRNYPHLTRTLPFGSFNSFSSLPISVILIDSLLFFLFSSALRISKRVYLELIKGYTTKRGLSTLIIGAGNTGEMILRDIKRTGYVEFYPVGFLDDDKRKIGTYLHGVKVLDKIENLEKVIKAYSIEAIIIAIASLSHRELTGIYISAKKIGVKTIKIIPKIYNFEKPEISVKKLEDINIEDLLARKTVQVDLKKIGSFLNHKKVLITGAGGSIGSEIALQTYQFNPSELILFDIDETELFNLELKLNKLFKADGVKLHFIVGDIRDYKKLEEVIESFRPQIIFHSAAYKHVPMMEYNPDEAVKVNVFGTYNLAKLSQQFGVEKFINISTDKAVRPKSIMGATKRLSEYICRAFNELGKTEYISVRFGNVVGSRGSVLPLWLEQIKQGGPITVTHPDMKRYFMTIHEAVSLVLMASAVGRGGEILVLDMGEPVKILDLAEQFIRINGLEPYRDIDIKFTGIRPGENLFEDILTAEEGTDATMYERIFIAKGDNCFTLKDIETIMDKFKKILHDKKGKEEIRKTLQEVLQENKISCYPSLLSS